ncbi:hypothetical protein [Solidesulfovibrio fructosivorans]|uniref:hypothetical protein n=1 Tax=Solidesulfovibrio fructosivorans TaxID=878 RepID=UPI0011805556|nr:hypothetical protein [Solidesulfovibrio fructosivorans]
MKSTLLFLPSFITEASLLTSQTKTKLFKIFKLLSDNPRHPSLQTSKIKPHNILYECRVDKTYRLVFDVQNNQLRLWSVGRHDGPLKFGELKSATSIHSDDSSVEDAIDFMTNRQFIELDYNNIVYILLNKQNV